MHLQILLGVAVAALVFIAGILSAPKAHTYEAAFASELHALYADGALEASHVEQWFELKLSQAKAELALTQARAGNIAGTLEARSTGATGLMAGAASAPVAALVSQTSAGPLPVAAQAVEATTQGVEAKL